MYDSEKKRIKNYKKMVSTYYSIITDLYIEFWDEHFHAAIWKNKNDSIEKALRNTHEMFASDSKLTKEDKAIDLGCGVGALSFFIAKNVGCNVTGLNLSKYQLKKANSMKKKMNIKNVDFVEMDIMDIDKELKDKFDAAFLIDVGCHLPDKKSALKNIHSILNKNGRLVIADWLQRDNLNNFEKTTLIDTFNKYWALPYMISLSQYEKILNEVGFKIIKSKDVSNYVKNTWENFYKVTLKAINDMTLTKMLNIVRNPEIILSHRKIALEVIKTQAHANIFTKVCSDAGVFRYGYIVAEKR
jgi:tocopherol O-methyltransferase